MFGFIVLALIVLSANGFIAIPTSVIAGGVIVAMASMIVDSILANVRKEYAPELVTPTIPTFPAALTLLLVIICAYGLILPWYGIVYVVFSYVIYILQVIIGMAQIVTGEY